MKPFRSSADRPRSQYSPRRLPVELRLESFEDRLTPAVFNIPAGDTDALVAAINTANINNQADTIELAAGSTYTFTAAADAYAGGDAVPQILRDNNSDINTLTIHGNGATLQRSPVVGTPNFRFFSMGIFPDNIAVSISNLSFVNGNANTNLGGAIYQQSGDLSLTGCTFQANQADTGGAVYVSTTSIPQRTVTVSNCNFLGNTATGAGTGGAGGAVYVVGDSSLSVDASQFSGNTAFHEGGAVREQTASQFVTITNSSLTANTASNGGGGVFVQGPTTLSGCVIDNNIGGSGGGGVWQQSATASLGMTGCTVNGNQATVSTAHGGGVFSQGTTTVSNCTIANNTVGSNGGGIYVQGAGLTITGTTVSGNSATNSVGKGGGVFCQAPLTMFNTTINANRAGNGGGLAFVSGSSTTGTVTDSTVTDNRAFFGLAQGGGIDVTGTGAFNLGDTIVAGNAFDPSVTSGTGPDIGGPVNSLGYNLIQITLGATITGNTTGNISGQSPNLGPLQNNGGPTQTRVPLAGSPVIDAGDPAFAPPPATDQRGAPRVVNGRIDIGAAEVVTPLTVKTLAVNDGSTQRSEVRSLKVTFSGLVTFAGGDANAVTAFQLNHVQTGNNVGLTAKVTTNGSNQTEVTLTFSGGETDPLSGQGNANPVAGLSLADGRYQLTINPDDVKDAAGFVLDGDGDGIPGGTYVSPTEGVGSTGLHLWRLYGDTTGDGVSDPTDLNTFRLAFNTNNQNPGSGYLVYLDANNDGAIDPTDLNQYRTRFNTNVF
jgi:parallel beta-helix repeat protein